MADNCGIYLVKCFSIYRSKKNKSGRLNTFIRVSYRLVRKKLIKLLGKKSKAFFFRSAFPMKKIDGGRFIFSESSCVVVKKRLYPRGKVSNGIVLYNVNRPKFLNSFTVVL